MKRMRPCDSCQRHVFTSERVCPFCSAELSELADAAPVAVPSSASRAQRLALAAALGGQSLLACAQNPSEPAPASPTAPAQAGSQAQGGVAVPVYGAPAPGTPPTAAAGQPAPNAGRAAPPIAGQVAVPVYGAPIAGHPAPDDDAGVPEAGKSAAGSGGHGPQAGKSAAGSGGGGHVAVPVYGAPIPLYGASPAPKKD